MRIYKFISTLNQDWNLSLITFIIETSNFRHLHMKITPTAFVNPNWLGKFYLLMVDQCTKLNKYRKGKGRFS